MSKTMIEVELSSAGTSNAGKEKLKGEAILADGSKAYVTVYRAVATEPKVARAVAPKVIKHGTPAAPAANPLAGLTAEQLEKLKAVMAQFSKA